MGRSNAAPVHGIPAGNVVEGGANARRQECLRHSDLFALALVGFEVGAEARYDFFFLTFVEFFLYFFEGEVDYVVMV